MDIHFLASRYKQEDIMPLFVGDEACEGGHTFGPFVRGYYLIHFCISGCGMLRDRYGEHKISSGEFFIIRPGEVTTYSADKLDPWHYCWIAFYGKLADIFDCGYSVAKTPDGMAERLLTLREHAERSPYAYTALIYELIYNLFGGDEESGAADRLHNVRKYIRYNYMDDIRVSALAHEFGFERSYLYRIFKQRYGISVKDYITKVRMENARGFLENGHSVAETAHLVGYDDEFNFSKCFKRTYGKSPSQITRGSKRT